MKKFKFRLESVRLDRERVEKLRLREWTIVNRMMMDLQAEKSRLEKRLSDAMSEMTAIKRASVVSTSIISEMENFIQGLKIRIDWKKGEIARAEKFVERKRVEWVTARQKRKVMDQLKEKQHQVYKDEQKTKELRHLDDLYIMKRRDDSPEGEL